MRVRASLLLMMFLLAGGAAAPAFRAIDDPHLHNAHIVTEKLISGALPDGDAGFKALAALGVKTIISVDGAKPDVERAKKHGIRYVHLPIGYDGVTAAQGKAIAKAINELPGRVYLHCHHGKHRSAAAVAVACVMNGSLEPAQAESVLRTFGTGANYTGLWAAAGAAKRLDVAEIQAFDVAFVEIAKLSDLVDLMVAADEHFEHLKQIQKSGWSPPADHPDLDPPHEALLVEEHLREAARLEEVKSRPLGFRKSLSKSEIAAKELRAALSKTVDAPAADGAMKQLSASCTSCHQTFRD